MTIFQSAGDTHRKRQVAAGAKAASGSLGPFSNGQLDSGEAEGNRTGLPVSASGIEGQTSLAGDRPDFPRARISHDFAYRLRSPGAKKCGAARLLSVPGIESPCLRVGATEASGCKGLVFRLLRVPAINVCSRSGHLCGLSCLFEWNGGVSHSRRAAERSEASGRNARRPRLSDASGWPGG